METRICGANSEEVVSEFKSRLLKHGINLDAGLVQILLEELTATYRDLILQRKYDRVVFPRVGYFYFKRRPARKLHVNLPNLKNEDIYLPTRWEISFRPSASLTSELFKIQ